MIVNNKYKVYWVHTPLYSYKKIEGILGSVLVSSGYNRAFSDCIITYEEPSSVVHKDGSRDMATKVLTEGRAIVHPNDTFDRKKGVFYSFKNAMENLKVQPITMSTPYGGSSTMIVNKREVDTARKLRTDFWKEYWRIRKNGIENSMADKTSNLFNKLNFEIAPINNTDENTSTNSSRLIESTESQIEHSTNNISEDNTLGAEHAQDTIEE